MLKNLILNFDMFPSLPLLRVKGQSDFVNFCGGLFSLILLLFFLYVFIQKLYLITTFQNIQANEDISMNRPDDKEITGMKFALGLQFMSLIALDSIFNVQMILRTKDQIIKSIPMAPCQKAQWKELEEGVFDTYQMGNCLCPTHSQTPIKGYFTSEQILFIRLDLYPCSNATSSTVCASPGQMAAFFANGLTGDSFLAKFLFLDTFFSPTQKDPLIKSINEQFIWLPFTPTLGNNLILRMGSFQIITDKSFFPMEVHSKTSGHFVDTDLFYRSEVNSNIYFSVMILSSKKHRVINRAYGKFDGLLSYLGGLFGILLSFFGFFLMSFNEYRYELWLSQGSFTFKNHLRVREKDLHFAKYVKYVVYDWVNSLCCCKLKWQDCKAIEETKQEAIEQIEVQHLLRRIGHLEDALGSLLPREVDIAFYLVEPKPIEAMKRRRRIANYYNVITDGQPHMTIKNIKLSHTLMSFAHKVAADRGFSLGDQRWQDIVLINPNDTALSEQEMTSLEIVDKYLGSSGSTESLRWKTEVELELEDLECEDELADAFYGMQEVSRSDIIDSIPMAILHRLRENYESRHSKQVCQIMPSLGMVQQKARKEKRLLGKARKNVVLEDLQDQRRDSIQELVLK